MKKVKNYARFFVLTKTLPGDHTEMRASLVNAFTGGRTTSLKEMTSLEYNRMCDSLSNRQPQTPQRDFTVEIKSKRSAVLKRIQKLDVDTSDWDAVDKFCLNPRIAGKRFRQLTLDDLARLIPKLEALARKPRPIAKTTPTAGVVWTFDMVAGHSGLKIVN